MAASITNLPTELVEEIAKNLDLRDLYSLRLSQPAVFPAQTTDRLRQIHRWNAALYSRKLVHEPWDWEGEKVENCEGDLVVMPRPHLWNESFKAIAQHELFSTWITSVNVSYPGGGKGYGGWELPYVGLGRVIANCFNLRTLWLGGGEIRNHDVPIAEMVLEEMLAAGESCKLQHLMINGAEIRALVLANFITSHNTTLRETRLSNIVLDGSWTQDVVPALQGCPLQFVLVDSPMMLHAKVVQFYGRTHVVFRHDNKQATPATHRTIRRASGRSQRFHRSFIWQPPFEEIVQMIGEEECETGLGLLCRMHDAFVMFDLDSFNDYDCIRERVLFCDWEQEMEYRKLYRAAQAHGQNFADENSRDPWFSSSLDWHITNKYYTDISQDQWGLDEDIEYDCLVDGQVAMDSDGEELGYEDGEDSEELDEEYVDYASDAE